MAEIEKLKDAMKACLEMASAIDIVGECEKTIRSSGVLKDVPEAEERFRFIQNIFILLCQHQDRLEYLLGQKGAQVFDESQAA